MLEKSKLLFFGLVAVLVIISAFFIQGMFEEKEVLKIATTTSLEDTGLLSVLEAKFEEKNPNIDVQFIATGTGQALEYGKKGDVDLVMVHSKKQEEQFIKEGYGTQRFVFAYNYFYILGPADDPAKVNGTNATTAFTNIMNAGKADATKVQFVSRGDNSGTNTREIQIWNKTVTDYNSSIRGQNWYIESGKGMGDTLVLADQKSAYTLSDSGTYLSYKGKIKLVALVTKGKDLLNIYSLIPVNKEKFSQIDNETAMKWVEFVMSAEGQELIGEYGVNKYGQQLFIPLAGQAEPTE